MLSLLSHIAKLQQELVVPLSLTGPIGLWNVFKHHVSDFSIPMSSAGCLSFLDPFFDLPTSPDPKYAYD